MTFMGRWGGNPAETVKREMMGRVEDDLESKYCRFQQWLNVGAEWEPEWCSVLGFGEDGLKCKKYPDCVFNDHCIQSKKEPVAGLQPLCNSKITVRMNC